MFMLSENIMDIQKCYTLHIFPYLFFFQVIVSVKNSDPEADKLKEFLSKEGKNVISKQLDKYVVALKEGKKCLLVIGL